MPASKVHDLTRTKCGARGVNPSINIASLFCIQPSHSSLAFKKRGNIALPENMVWKGGRDNFGEAQRHSEVLSIFPAHHVVFLILGLLGLFVLSTCRRWRCSPRPGELLESSGDSSLFRPLFRFSWLGEVGSQCFCVSPKRSLPPLSNHVFWGMRDPFGFSLPHCDVLCTKFCIPSLALLCASNLC